MRFSPAVPRQAAQLALARAFAAAGLATPSLDARVLLCEALGTDHAGLIRDGEAELGAAAARLAGFAERRLAGEPVGRILGRRDFFALSFRLGPDTLEPRPDSETLVEAARDLLVAREAGPLRLLDLGTGTGAILAALLSVFPGAFGIGVDRAFGACRVAADNLRDLGLSARGVLFCGDWAEALGEPFDLVVSNPPYVASREVAALPPTVRDHDPPLALDGGPDGLAAYRAIVPAAAARLAPGGWLLLEVGVGQAETVTALLDASGFGALGSRRDLGGHVRVVYGQTAACRGRHLAFAAR